MGNGGRNGPSPVSSPSHSPSTHHSWALQPQATAYRGLTRFGSNKSQGMGPLWLLQQGIAKRSPAPEPDAEGHTLDLSMTANMDTLRQRLIFALRNRASQGGRDLEIHG